MARDDVVLPNRFQTGEIKTKRRKVELTINCSTVLLEVVSSWNNICFSLGVIITFG